MLEAMVVERVQKVCPIEGISFGVRTDKSTWEIQFADIATDAEKVAAQASIDSFTLADYNAERDRLAEIENFIKSDAIVHTLKGYTNAEFDAWWTANVTNIAQVLNILKRVTRVVIRRVL